MKLKHPIILALWMCLLPQGFSEQPESSLSDSTPKLCAAVRGNGGSLMAHFGALASIIENFGVVDGISGGSSASVSIFFYESMLANPVLWDCEGRRCSEDEVRPRLALMLKSIMGGVNAVIDLAGGKETLENMGKKGAQAGKMGELYEFLKYGFQNPGRGPLRRRIVSRIADRVMSQKMAEFEYSTLGRFINGNHMQALRNYGLHLPAHRRWEILLAAQGLDFNTEDVSLFFREGLLNYDQLVNVIGRVGDFYANRGPIPQNFWKKMFSEGCLNSSKNLTWNQISQSSEGRSCAQSFENGLKYFFQATLNSHYQSTRLKEKIGLHLKTLVSDSVIVGEGVTKYRRGLEEYESIIQSSPYCSYFDRDFPRFRAGLASIKFELDFMNEVKFGYWGTKSDLEKVAQGTAARKEDIKSSLFMNLGTQTWDYILHRSPAEPGLSRLVPMGDHLYSSGGWSDLHPIPVLKDIGCEKVVYISRTHTVDSEYGVGLVRLFNIPKDIENKLYSLENPESSFMSSLRAADAVVCSNWNGLSNLDFMGHFEDSYQAPIATQDPELRSKARSLLADPLPGCVAP
ncbi:MAG: hypothetical protein ACKOA8_05370 [Deltaproteobacteria bacterium]